MSNTLSRLKIDSSLSQYLPVLLLGGAWLILYWPVYADFAQTAWRREENAHAPFVMAICIGLAWTRLSSEKFSGRAGHAEFLAGLFALCASLGAYYVGRRAGIELIESASQALVATTLILCLYGVRGLQRLWFPLLLMVYLIIWPGWALDSFTAPLKQFVSQVVGDSLFALGLPVAHAGAVISAGPYELLVADACAGLNSLIALTAVGAVYLYAVKRKSVKTNLAVILALVPLAIIANLVRVAILVLITYYGGYDAGQSFLHEGAGLVMFAVALLGVFAVDAVAAFFWEPRK